MKKLIVSMFSTLLIMIVSINSYGAGTHIDHAAQEAVQAGSHASASAAHAIASSGQVTSAALAVPLAVGSSVGAVSNQAATDLMNAATAPIGTPLIITDETFTASPPPDEVLVPNNQ